VSSINSTTAAIEPDEGARASGLFATRAEGYRHLLDVLHSVREETGGRLLEVGSSYGWFLEACGSDFDTRVGIEPDDAVRRAPAGCEARAGYFPEAVAAGECFDVVVFNDVFEHIPDAHRTTAAVAEHLNAGGIAVINLPVASGGMYRLTKLAHRIGVRGPFERMWQRHFPSPHLYYFTGAGIISAFDRAGLTCVYSTNMPTMRLRGIWFRIRHAEPRLAVAIMSFVAALAVLPISRLLPADVRCFYFTRLPKIT